ncbi:MAG: FHA domain-containing protein FhaB/FipA [Stackebrandtia sp.]
MPELVYTVARFGLLVLLWVFVFAVARAIRRDVFAGGASFGKRQAAGPARGQGPGRPGGQRPPRELVVTAGDRRGVRLPLRGAPIRIGRAPDSTLVITDDYASSRHAQLVPRGDQWILEDVGSTNGTYLGHAKVTGPTPVPLGTPIRIGRTSIELRP